VGRRLFHVDVLSRFQSYLCVLVVVPHRGLDSYDLDGRIAENRLDTQTLHSGRCVRISNFGIILGNPG
jgi:hypothetical protein